MFNKAKQWLNKYIAPHDFVAMTVFEDEHPLMERERERGQRNITIYHTAGANLKPLGEQMEIVGDLYSLEVISNPESKGGWTQTYEQVLERMEQSG